MPFVKGKSGNPGGRKKKPITEMLEMIGMEELEDGMTRNEHLARVMWGKAAEGDVLAQKYITDRMEGTPHQSITADIVDRRPIMISGIAKLIDDETDSTNS